MTKRTYLIPHRPISNCCQPKPRSPMTITHDTLPSTERVKHSYAAPFQQPWADPSIHVRSRKRGSKHLKRETMRSNSNPRRRRRARRHPIHNNNNSSHPLHHGLKNQEERQIPHHLHQNGVYKRQNPFFRPAQMGRCSTAVKRNVIEAFVGKLLRNFRQLFMHNLIKLLIYYTKQVYSCTMQYNQEANV